MELVVDDKPDDSDVTRLFVVESPLEVEVDRLAIELVVVLRPVLSCETVTASVGAEPSATLVMRRSAVAEPTDTSEVGAAWPVRKPVVVGAAAAVALPEPIATLFAYWAEALGPSATANWSDAVAPAPAASEEVAVATENRPIAIEVAPDAVAPPLPVLLPPPIAMALLPVASVSLPIADAPTPCAFEPEPTAIALEAVATALWPNTVENTPVAVAPLPMAIEVEPVAVEP